MGKTSAGCREESRKRCLAAMQADPGDARHGTHCGYIYGCRCERCLAAAMEYERAYRARTADSRREGRRPGSNAPDAPEPRENASEADYRAESGIIRSDGTPATEERRCDRCRDSEAGWTTVERSTGRVGFARVYFCHLTDAEDGDEGTRIRYRCTHFRP